MDFRNCGSKLVLVLFLATQLFTPLASAQSAETRTAILPAFDSAKKDAPSSDSRRTDSSDPLPSAEKMPDAPAPSEVPEGEKDSKRDPKSEAPADPKSDPKDLKKKETKSTKAYDLQEKSPEDPTAKESWTRGAKTSFNVNDSSGAATYQYALDLPSGRHQMSPSLSLSYSSEQKNPMNIFGTGWNLDTGYISRSHEKGSEKIYTENDFTLNIFGTQKKLVPVSLTDGKHGEYGAEMEDEFLKITFQKDESWTVTSKSGTKYTFGKTAATRQDDTSDTTKIYQWMLQEVRDTNDNFMRFTYTKDSGAIIPDKIFYTGSGNSDGPYEIDFTTEKRTDIFTSYAPGFLTTNQYRIKEITLLVSNTWSKKWTLIYTNDGNQKKSLLKSITAKAQDTAGNITTLPPVTFEYSKKQKGWTETKEIQWPAPAYQDGTDWIYLHINGDNNHDTGVRILDVNGDGRTDILNADSYKPAALLFDGKEWKKDAGWEIPGFVNSPNGDINAMRIADVNGDNLPDFVESRSEIVYSPFGSKYTNNIYLNTGSTWKIDSGWKFPKDQYGNSLPFNSSGGVDQGIRFVDVNGDGLVDIVQGITETSSPPIQDVYLNTGKGWEPSKDFKLPVAFVSDNKQVQGAEMADVNADGLMDFIQSNAWEPKKVFLNTGKGWTEDPKWVFPVLLIGNNNLQQNVEVVDVNNDGLPDVVQAYQWYGVNGETKDIYINTGAGWTLDPTWKPPMNLGSNYPLAEGVAITDINGDGLVDFVKAYDYVAENKIFLSSTDGKVFVDDILTAVHESQGGSYAITYTPSTWQADNKKLPFPVQTVSQVQASDGLGNTTTETYQYSGGRFYTDPTDPRKNFFTGFQKVKSISSTGDSTEKYFHIDGERAKIGRQYLEKHFDAVKGQLTASRTNWQVQTLQNSPERFFISVQEAFSVAYDPTGNARASAVSYEYDSFGNVKQETDFGEVTANADSGTFTDIGSDMKKISTTTATDSSGILRNIPASVTVTNIIDTQLAEELFTYDNQNFGTVTKGNLTKHQQWLDAKNGYVTRSFAYDSFGNIIQETDPMGNVGKIDYSADGMFPVKFTNPKGFSETLSYSLETGNVTSRTDANGLKKNFNYDGFGRLKAAYLAGTLVQNVMYDDQKFPGSMTVWKFASIWTSPDMQESYEYFDGFGRSIQTRVLTDTKNFSVIRKSYDQRNRVDRVSLPVSETTASFTTKDIQTLPHQRFFYDGLDRVKQTQNPIATETVTFAGWSQTRTDAKGHSHVSTSDAYGRLIQVDEYLSGKAYSTKYSYDLLGNLTKITDAAGNVRNFSYDSLGRRVFAEDLHAPGDTTFSTWTYSYDDNGNLLSKKDVLGGTLTYTYDSLDRLIAETGKGVNITYTYDTEKNGIGKLGNVSMTSNGENIFTSYSYDEYGRIATETRQIKGTGFVTSYSYDLLGRALSVTSPSGITLKYAYTPSGSLQKLDRVMPDGSVISVITSKTYNAAGQVTNITYGSGIQSSYTYDTVGRLTSKKTFSGATTYQDMTYEFDAVGNVTKMSEKAGTSLKKEVTYTYDDLDRLIVADIKSASPSTMNFTYDILGNILEKPGAGTYSYENTGYANPHAVTKIISKTGTEIFSYDENGNLKEDGARLLTWNTRGELTAVQIKAKNTKNPSNIKGSGTISFAYDQTGTRVLQWNTLGKTTTSVNSTYEVENFLGKDTARVFIYDGSNLVETIEDSPENIKNIITDDFSSYRTTFTNWKSLNGAWNQETGKNLTQTDKDTFAIIAKNLSQQPAPASPKGSSLLYGFDLQFGIPPAGATANATPGAGLYFMLTDPKNINLGGYKLFQSQSSLSLFRLNATGETLLLAIPSPTNKILNHYDLRFIPNFGIFQVRKNGVVMGTATDPNPITTGSAIEFNTVLTTASFDNFTFQTGTPKEFHVYQTHTDHLGSSSIVTGTGIGSNTGSVSFTGTTGTTPPSILQEIDLDPYGSVSSNITKTSFDTKKKFTGKELDDDTGLTYFNARYYDSRMGRFVSLDRASLYTMGANSFVDPQNWNSYSYVRNNPVKYTDPSGMCLWDLCIGEISATTYGLMAIGVAAIGMVTTVVKSIQNLPATENKPQVTDQKPPAPVTTTPTVDPIPPKEGKGGNVTTIPSVQTNQKGENIFYTPIVPAEEKCQCSLQSEYGATPEGKPYTKHYGQETGPQRNIPGSVVDDVVNNHVGIKVGNGKTVYYDPSNNVTVVTGNNGAIVSARKGAPPKEQLEKKK